MSCQRVAVNPSRWCGTCPRCREGRRNLCENIYFMGSASKTPHMQGGFSTRFDATPAQCVPVPHSGHLPHLERPEEFDTLLLDFLRHAKAWLH